jgi:hypothetical protein
MGSSTLLLKGSFWPEHCLPEVSITDMTWHRVRNCFSLYFIRRSFIKKVSSYSLIAWWALYFILHIGEFDELRLWKSVKLSVNLTKIHLYIRLWTRINSSGHVRMLVMMSSWVSEFFKTYMGSIQIMRLCLQEGISLVIITVFITCFQISENCTKFFHVSIVPLW